MRRIGAGLACLFVLVVCRSGYGMATEQIGPDRPDRPTFAQPGWPKGIVEILRHESRVYSIWVNGNENFYFQATPADVNELVRLFSTVRMRDHEVAIAAERQPVKTFGGDAVECNVHLQVVTGIALFMAREGKATIDLPLEPRLTIYAGDAPELVKGVTWPKHLVIRNEIPGLSIPSGRTKPERDAYYGRLTFADGSPPSEFVQGANSRITLWEQKQTDGIEVAKVNNEGYFSVPLSKEELADLQTGKTWLTVTIGNWLTEATKADQRFPAEMLMKDKGQTQPVAVKRIAYYWGRILFEDGTPPVLDPAPWPGAEISVDFPFAGSAQFESDGYFKVMFTAEQFQKLSADKPRKNIYVPSYKEKNTSTATETYPVSLLSQDKSKAGVVKIPRPTPPKPELVAAASMLGKPIPGFAGVRFEAFAPEQAQGKPLLVCFWDVDQRPSRQCIQSLEKQKATVQAKNLVVLAIHAGPQQPSKVKDWLRENGISLPAGAIEGDSHDVLLVWGARGMPWLVLTDERHVVTKEGANLADFLPGE